MSSTSSDDRAARTRRFFEEQLMPAAKQILARRGQLFATRPDPEADSYYVARARTRMSREDFEPEMPASPEELEPALRRFWEARDLPELAALAPGLAELARCFYEQEQQEDEVSPFIYVMF